jgi:hypothetical protein
VCSAYALWDAVARRLDACVVLEMAKWKQMTYTLQEEIDTTNWQWFWSLNTAEKFRNDSLAAVNFLYELIFAQQNVDVPLSWYSAASQANDTD